MELGNALENMGAQMVKEVASKTSDTAGDGTTTATSAGASDFVREGAKNVTAGANPMAIKRRNRGGGRGDRGLRTAEDVETGDRATIAQVGTIFANHDETIGRLIAEAMEKVGKDGVITVEEAKGIETTLDIVEGRASSSAALALSPYFVTNPERMEVVLKNPLHPRARAEDRLDERALADPRARGPCQP